jgi:hypothetical protein
MNKTSLGLGALAACALALPVHAADHIDSPAAIGEPSADITDLYAWMSADATKVNLVMNVSPFATGESSFSSAVQYVFHLNSSAGYGEAQTESNVICELDDAGLIECWGGGAYVQGDPSSEDGLVSADGTLRVFAGMRDDPFFFEFDGFTAVVEAVIAAAGGLTFDDDGCPALDPDTGAALRAQLAAGTDGAPASDTFRGQNVLSLVVQIDADTVTPGGPLLGVWASTHRK